MNNFKKIGGVIAVLAIIIVIAVVVIANWGKWTKNLVNATGKAIGVGGVGDAIFGDTLDSNSSVTLAP